MCQAGLMGVTEYAAHKFRWPAQPWPSPNTKSLCTEEQQASAAAMADLRCQTRNGPAAQKQHQPTRQGKTVAASPSPLHRHVPPELCLKAVCAILPQNSL